MGGQIIRASGTEFSVRLHLLGISEATPWSLSDKPDTDRQDSVEEVLLGHT